MRCKAIVQTHTGQRIAVPYRCTRNAKSLQGFCKQHYRVVYGKRIIAPDDYPKGAYLSPNDRDLPYEFQVDEE
jgi:hypothetical protein